MLDSGDDERFGRPARFVFTDCGPIFDADVSAAKNILKVGIGANRRT